ncbi:MAG: WYL domain-containing protein [Eubacterium sp.]|nr:WYL domain-containing protein [Eubacterium sp.]
MKGRNQKLKMLYLAKIMQEQTDENHPLTMPEIITKLEHYDIEATRKTIYDDFELLSDYGIEIIKEQKGSKTYYFCGSREFEAAEVKMIVDAIASSKFITAKKSKELIGKMEHMLSDYDARVLDRTVYVSGRVKNMNTSAFYTVDVIQSAIANDRRITFQYFSWNAKGEKELRHGGKIYDISPWALVWDNENYYLVGYDAEVSDIKHFRVDKMLKTAETDRPREGRKRFQQEDKEFYTRKHFRMFRGKEERVTLLCKNEIANVVVDHFGTDILLQKVDDEHFRTKVTVVISDQFLGWVVALGGDVVIESPESARDRMRLLLEMNGTNYEKNE